MDMSPKLYETIDGDAGLFFIFINDPVSYY